MSGPTSKGGLIGASSPSSSRRISATEYRNCHQQLRWHRRLVDTCHRNASRATRRWPGRQFGPSCIRRSRLQVDPRRGMRQRPLLRLNCSNMPIRCYDLRHLICRRRCWHGPGATRIRRESLLSTADLTRLPYADSSIRCRRVRLGARAFARSPARIARTASRDGAWRQAAAHGDRRHIHGPWCGRLWHCRTYDRGELRAACKDCNLMWSREHWFSGFHRKLGLGGIIVELKKG